MSEPASMPGAVSLLTAARASVLWHHAIQDLRNSIEFLPADLPLMVERFGARLRGAADVSQGDERAWLTYLADTVDALALDAMRQDREGVA